MSLNTAHVQGGSCLIHAGECIILFTDAVTIDFHGQDGRAFHGSKIGKVFLTTHRLIFINKSDKDELLSFSMPFVTLKDVELEQPVFGSNYIKGKVRAQPNGNWVGEAKFKLVFKKGGAIDFGQAMLRAASMASSNFPQTDNPPPYVPPQGPYYMADVPYGVPPPGYYGWMPSTAAFPDAPPPQSVYRTDMPPPYPGIIGFSNNPGYASAPPAQSAPQPQQLNGQDLKAAEAAQSAYFDPNRPQMAYVPPPSYYELPPPYKETENKKND
ncbi:WW domain-binding protein 2 isoform X1 [Daktulosphaira vitifoliae]|uniref:WW domain-binding protein 2 isoform X1 n=1 Tax=Daktulosphaira vitifoliae TaxID=58002 RepID=UPI0021A9B1C9|nr:WW domain-binding protein 2 isoform X1 [Daktulosphaira vitifoliae]